MSRKRDNSGLTHPRTSPTGSGTVTENDAQEDSTMPDGLAEPVPGTEEARITVKRKLDAFEIVVALICVSALVYVCFFGGQTPRSNVLLLDIGGAHNLLGRNDQLTEDMNKRKDAMEAKLSDLRAELEQNLADRRNEFGETPTREQQMELIQLRNEFTKRVSQETQQSRQSLEQSKRQVLLDFMLEVRPVASEIAARRGAQVVLNSDRVVTFDAAVDITEEVVEVLKSKAQSTAE